MTGFRLGWLVAPREQRAPAADPRAEPLHLARTASCSARGSPRSRTARRSVRAMRDAYARRRDRMVAGLRALGFGVPHVPDGAFYVFADARAFAQRLARARVRPARARARRHHARRRLRRGGRGLAALLVRGLRRDDRGGARAARRRAAARGDEPASAPPHHHRGAAHERRERGGLPGAGAARDRVPRPLERRQVEPAERAGRAARARAHLVDARQDAPAQLVPRRARRPRALARRSARLRLCEGREERARASGSAGSRPTSTGRRTLRLAVLLQDLRRDPSEDETLLLEWLAERGVPALVALTKCDKEKPMRRAERVRALGQGDRAARARRSLATSAETGARASPSSGPRSSA